MNKSIIKIQEKQETELIFPINHKVVVGIHGTPGSFTEESLQRFCEETGVDIKTLDIKYLVEADKVVEAVVNGEIDRGVVAIANSGSGLCTFTMHALSKHKLTMAATYGMQVSQCMLAHPSMESIDRIEQIFAHPQAIDQCQRTLDEQFENLEIVPGKDADDTALCAKKIADGVLPKTTATLGSALAAEKYGLNILKYDLQHDPMNMTTFLIIKK